MGTSNNVKQLVKSTSFFVSLSILAAVLFFLEPNIVFGEPNFKTTEKIVNVLLSKQEENYNIDDIKIIIGKYSYLENYDFYKNKVSNGIIKSFNGQSLAYFPVNNNLSIVQCSDRIKNNVFTGGCEIIPTGKLTIQLPYFPNGKYADIFDPSGKKVLTIDLTPKATCNENDKCDQPIEDSENCPHDCKENEPKIDPAVVKKAAADQQVAQEAEKKISFSNLGWWGIAILIVLLVGGVIGYHVYRKNRDY